MFASGYRFANDGDTAFPISLMMSVIVHHQSFPSTALTTKKAMSRAIAVGRPEHNKIKIGGGQMPSTSLVARMAEKHHLDVNQFYKTVRNTVMPKAATDDQLAAFLMVADRYGLDPITREIYAFPGRGGGITPVLSVDGWINLVNSHPQANGFEFKYAQDNE